MICGSFVNLSSFKDIRTISQNQNTTISIATDTTNAAKKYIFKTFNFNCTIGHHQKIFLDVFSDVSSLSLSNTSIPANNYAISQNQCIFSYFNATHYYENFSTLDFSGRLKPTFGSICISEITLDKILRKQVQISSNWMLEDTINCLFSVAIAMKRLHDNLIIHGNLCPSNIIVDKVKQCYISDFGLYRIKELYCKPPITNPQYSAPELVHDYDFFHPTVKSDIFSYGVIMCRLLQEFFFPNNNNLVQLILEGRFDFNQLPPFLSKIISKCLQKFPENRCNFDFVVQSFQVKSFVIKRINIADHYAKFKNKCYIERLANANDSNALNILGDLLSDPNKAFEIKDKKSNSKQKPPKKSFDENQSIGLNLKYENKINCQLAAECYKRSANLGNSEAQANYGICLLNGNGVPIHMLEGLSYIEKSFKQGCIKGLYTYGICFMKGFVDNGVDINKAERYLRAAIDAFESNSTGGNNAIICKARYNLGLILRLKNNHFEANRCIKLAAYMALESKTNFCSPTSFACPESLYDYGRYLKYGIGTNSDIPAACYFFKMAHLQGYKPGSFEYAKIILDNEINTTNGTEISSKYEKKEASLIMKSLVEMDYRDAVEYLDKIKSSQSTSKESSKHSDKEKEKKSLSGSEKSSSNSNSQIDSSKNRAKKTIPKEKLQDKFEKYQKDLIENRSTRLFDYEKSFIESNDADIIYKLAEYYDTGKYVKKDTNKAFDYYKLAAELGNSDAQYIYGCKIIDDNFEGGLKMLQNSAIQGNPAARDYYMKYIIEAKNTDSIVLSSLRKLKEKADKGANKARFIYGKLLTKGPKNDDHTSKEGFHEDVNEGIKYLKMAAEANESDAIFYYAYLLLKGKGIPKNEKKAIKILEKSAIKENNEKAILKCAKYFFKTEPDKALWFLQLGAEKGNKKIMYEYGNQLIKMNKDKKKGEEYLIKSKMPTDHVFEYYKKSNGKYVEIQEPLSYDKRLKKLDDIFSDDYEMKVPEDELSPKESSKQIEDEPEIEDLEPEKEEEEQKFKVKSIPEIIKKPLTNEEAKKINKELILSHLEERKNQGLSPENFDEKDIYKDAINGDSEAMNYLGKIFKEFKKTQQIASYLFKYSYERNNLEGLMEYADCLMNGIGFRQNKKLGYQLIETAADKYELPDALYQFGNMNEYGNGCQISKYKAFQYYKRAADKNEIRSMMKVAEYFERGISRFLPKDYKQMVKYYKKVIKINSNNPKANFKLGEYYLITEKNPKEALKYLREAAASNKYVKSYYYLYKLYSEFDYGPKFITVQEADEYLEIACKGNDKDALDAYEKKFKHAYKQSPEQSSPIGAVNYDDDDYDDYEVNRKKKSRHVKNEPQQYIPQEQESIEFDNDKDFILQVLKIDPSDLSPQQIIKIGDDILEKASTNYNKKQTEIEKVTNSKAAALAASKAAQDEYNTEKSKAERCFSYAMNKGDPLGYLKYGQLINDPDKSLSCFKYAKDNGVPGADVEYNKFLEKAGDLYLKKYHAYKKESNLTEAEYYKSKLNSIAQSFIDEDAYVKAALYFKGIGDTKKYDFCIELAKGNLEILDGTQQFILGQILEKNHSKSSSESDEKAQNKLILDVYSHAVQNGCVEAKPYYKRLSEKVLHEMTSNSEDSKSLNELGVSFFEGRNGAEINYEKAAEYFEKAASNGSIDGMVNYGKCLLFGNGVPQDEQKAFQYFMKASLYNHTFSQLISSPSQQPLFSIQNSDDNESSTTSSDDEYSSRRSSIYIDTSKGNESLAEGIYYYASCLLKGRCTTEKTDINQIIQMFKLAAHMGNINAMVQYGKYSIKEPDGQFFLRQAANSGNPEAQYLYSNFLKNDDDDLSKQYLKQAAENKSYKPTFPPETEKEKNDLRKAAGYYEPAVEEWGKVLYDKIVSGSDSDDAIAYFKKLSDNKNVYGLSMYAKCIYNGVIDESDDESSSTNSKYLKYLKMAADLGDSNSQYSYALSKMEDEEENHCSEEVSKYLKMAADQGNVRAARTYADRLETGKGVKRDLKEAEKYCQKALSIDSNIDVSKILLDRSRQT